MGRKTNKGAVWSAETIQKALRTRFVCGSNGYDELIGQGMPLPTQRTLRRSMENIEFNSGILEDIFSLMKPKVLAMQETEKEACLTLDEMKIEQRIEWDKAQDKFLGYVTLPKHAGKADHAFVFMLSGVSTRWKQVCAYYYTGPSTDGSVLMDIITNIIQKAHDIGLRIICVTSDMGAANQKMWKSFNISANRILTKNYTPHPCNSNQKLCFMADPPHVLKNIRNFFVSKQTVTLPQNIVDKYKLPSNIVSVEPICALLEAEKNAVFILAPKLSDKMLHPGQFDKMSVALAEKLFSNQITAAIKLKVNNKTFPETYATTAWLFDNIRRWFDLMTSRTPKLAISKLNEDVYKETIQFLQNFQDIFKTASFGDKWKPIQTAVLLSTQSVLDIQEDFLNRSFHTFLLTSRLTQCCLESLFSCIRKRMPTPTPLQFKYNLRIVALGQYLKAAKNSNYDEDNSQHLVDLKTIRLMKNRNHNTQIKDGQLSYDVEIPNDVLNDAIALEEQEAFKYVAGYCVFQVNAICTTCKLFIENSHITPEFIQLMSYKEGCLRVPSEPVLKLLTCANNLFCRVQQNLVNEESVLKKLLINISKHDVTKDFPLCHNVCDHLLNCFFRMRLHMLSKTLSADHNVKTSVNLSSKSIAMRQAVKKY